MKIKIITIGNITEKPLEGKTYSVWTYEIQAEYMGRTATMYLKSFTRQPMSLTAGQDLEVDKQEKEWQGKKMVDYIIKNEKKPFTPGGGKFTPREKLSTADFEKMVTYCWGLAVKTGAMNPADAFDKILGVASMNLDISTIQSGTAAVSQVFAPAGNDDEENIPF